MFWRQATASRIAQLTLKIHLIKVCAMAAIQALLTAPELDAAFSEGAAHADEIVDSMLADRGVPAS